MKRIFVITLLIFLLPFAAQAKTVEYNFDIDYKTVNFTGKDVQAIAVGGSIPAPLIEVTVGDILRVTFNNKMAEETSIHWHGVLLPNDQDGVPYLTTLPIAPHTSFTYEFPIKHSGTYWYHSHTGLQEQRGVYGPLVFHPKNGERQKADYDYTVVFSDWTNENPDDVLAHLKKDGDYYALKKDSVQSWLKVIQHGPQAIKNRLKGSWGRMGPMDISDVGYDAFLANGEEKHNLVAAKKGETVRVRMVNAAASSYFNVEFSGGDMTIVSADGVDLQPKKVSRIRIAVAETFDILVTIPDNKAYELRATSEDGTGYSSTIIGKGELVKAPDIPKPNPFLMDHSMHDMSGMDMSGMDHAAMGHDMSNMDMSGMDHAAMGHDMSAMEPAGKQVEYQGLRAVEKTALPEGRPIREVPLRLTGNMERFVWTFNNMTLGEADKILIRKGENVRFIFKNETMMHHPLHLHGHFFRVLNGEGDYAPLKHVVNVPPMQTVTIEFAADEEKDWFFHCHNLYHLKSGMARIISYEGSVIDPALLEARKSAGSMFHDQWFFSIDTAVQSNMTNGMWRASNTRNAFELEFDWNYEGEYEAEAVYERSINRFFDLYAGAETERENNDTDTIGIAGFHYVLPLLIDANGRVDSDAHGRLGLSSELQLTDRTSFEWEVNTDREYRLQLEYEMNKKISFVGNRDDQFDWGAGIMVKF